MVDHDTIKAATAEWDAARAQSKELTSKLAAGALGATAIATVAAAWLGAVTTSSGWRYPLAGVYITLLFVPVSFALGRASLKEQERGDNLAKTLGRQLSDAVRRAEEEASRREHQVRRQEFEARLSNALEMAEGEPEVIDAVERAFAVTLPDAPVELLLADSSHAHLSRMAFRAPDGVPPACSVDSPDHCPAARRAQVQRFADSDELDACPKLRDHAHGRCSAVCVPVSIMGRTVGVIHAKGVPGEAVSDEKVQDLATLANLTGARIGLLRMMAETQLQAATDSLTGLLNRRSLENKVHQLRADGRSFSVVMADLDHFKRLNDTYGHETGDRALRLFAETLRSTLRTQDLVSRHGGEEFAVVLPECTADDARRSLEQVRTSVAAAADRAGLPTFSASFGVVEARPDEDLVTLLARADGALFQAKHDGSDRIVVHDGDGHQVSREGRNGHRPEPGLARR